MPEAHDQKEAIHLLCHYPAHDPRESDPHYHLFNQAKARLKKLGLMKCVVCGATQHVELHHNLVEFSLQEGVDLEKFNQFYGLHLKDDEEFKQYIEQEGNLEPLCTEHHRSAEGIHFLPVPFWNALRVWKDDLPPPAEVVKGE